MVLFFLTPVMANKMNFLYIHVVLRLTYIRVLIIELSRSFQVAFITAPVDKNSNLIGYSKITCITIDSSYQLNDHAAYQLDKASRFSK